MAAAAVFAPSPSSRHQPPASRPRDTSTYSGPLSNFAVHDVPPNPWINAGVSRALAELKRVKHGYDLAVQGHEAWTAVERHARQRLAHIDALNEGADRHLTPAELESAIREATANRAAYDEQLRIAEQGVISQLTATVDAALAPYRDDPEIDLSSAVDLPELFAALGVEGAPANFTLPPAETRAPNAEEYDMDDLDTLLPQSSPPRLGGAELDAEEWVSDSGVTSAQCNCLACSLCSGRLPAFHR